LLLPLVSSHHLLGNHIKAKHSSQTTLPYASIRGHAVWGVGGYEAIKHGGNIAKKVMWGVIIIYKESETGGQPPPPRLV